MPTSRWSIAALATLAACGESGPTQTAEQFLGELLPAVCAKAAECGHMPDEGTCLEIVTGDRDGVPYEGPLLDAVADGRLRFDPAIAVACLAGIEAAACEDRVDLEELRCGQAFVPAQPAGEPCYHDVEVCVAGTTCVFPDGCTADTCCAGTCTADTAAAIPPGGACDGTVPCALDNACIGGKCRFPSADGDPCAGSCAGALVCDEATCRAAAPRAALNEPCASTLDCQPALYCAWDSAQNTDICKRWRLVGEPCDLNDPATKGCPPWLFCDTATQTCATRPREGTACGDATPCLGLGLVGDTCFEGMCTEPRAAGSYCTDGAQCTSGTCTASVCEATLVCP